MLSAQTLLKDLVGKRPPSSPAPSRPARPSGTARLICTSGPYAGQSFRLGRAPASIGRSLDRHIILSADSAVSRRHARIVFEQDCHVISDSESANGTLVNGKPIRDARPLRHGDILEIGKTLLRYEEEPMGHSSQRAA